MTASHRSISPFDSALRSGSLPLHRTRADGINSHLIYRLPIEVPTAWLLRARGISSPTAVALALALALGVEKEEKEKKRKRKKETKRAGVNMGHP